MQTKEHLREGRWTAVHAEITSVILNLVCQQVFLKGENDCVENTLFLFPDVIFHLLDNCSCEKTWAIPLSSFIWAHVLFERERGLPKLKRVHVVRSFLILMKNMDGPLQNILWNN